MRIAYLVWLENLRTPILAGQVIRLLEEMAGRARGLEIHFFAFQPLYRLLLRRSELREIRIRLESSGVRVTMIPCLSMPGVDLFRARWYLLALIFVQSLPVLLVLTVLKRIRLLHCRSYPITWAALVVRRLLGTKVIFDPRSDFPEESLMGDSWSETSLSYSLWKRLERWFLKTSDATVAISDTYVRHYVRIAPSAGFVNIPNNVDTELFRRDDAFRTRFRNENGLSEDAVVLCYSGSMGTHWHRPDPYARLILSLRDLNRPHLFLFVTQDREQIRSTLDRYGVPADHYRIVGCQFGDVPRYLSGADLGMMLMVKPKIAVGIKTVEYLSMGLPVLANENAAGAMELIDRYGVGLVIDETGKVDSAKLEDLIARKRELSVKCRRLAVEHFSTPRVAKRYADLYDTLLT